MYATTKIRIASYLSQSEDQWFKIVWDRDVKKEYVSLHRTIEQEFAGVGVRMKFNDREIELNNDERLEVHEELIG